MKLLFRFFRGELNGFFLNALCTFLNAYLVVTEILDELVYNRRFQWVLEENVTAGQLPIRTDDIYNIGKIGGLFQPRTMARTSLGSVWFTDTYTMKDGMYNGVSRAERALFNMNYERFFFHKIVPDVVPTSDDINKLATEIDRATYREAGAKLLGYVAEGTELFTPAGDIIGENIIPVEAGPPADTAYIEWYGLKYTPYEEFFDKETPLTVDVYKMLFECVQKIRRRGPNILSLIEITEILGGSTTIRNFRSLEARDAWYTANVAYLVRGAYCGVGEPPVYLVYTGKEWTPAKYPPPSYIVDLDIAQVPIEDADGNVINQMFRCTYSLDDGATVFNQVSRYVAWRHLCAAKFKMFTFVDRATQE